MQILPQRSGGPGDTDAGALGHGRARGRPRGATSGTWWPCSPWRGRDGFHRQYGRSRAGATVPEWPRAVLFHVASTSIPTTAIPTTAIPTAVPPPNSPHPDVATPAPPLRRVVRYRTVLLPFGERLGEGSDRSVAQALDARRGRSSSPWSASPSTGCMASSAPPTRSRDPAPTPCRTPATTPSMCCPRCSGSPGTTATINYLDERAQPQRVDDAPCRGRTC